jgi:hypothetical protein
MKIIACNCRGLGNRSAVRGLLEVHKVERVDILFLSETKLDRRRMERFCWMLGLTNMVVRDLEGQGGECLCCGGEGLMCHFAICQGITLMWR